MRHLRAIEAKPVATVSESLGTTQARMLATAESAGLSLNDAFARLGMIIKEGEDDATALVAIRTLFDYTTGRAPSNARTLNMHVSGKSDAFFDRATFEKPPAPRIEE